MFIKNTTQPLLVNKVSISFMVIGLVYFLLASLLGIDLDLIAQHIFLLFSLDFEFLCCGPLAFIPRYFYLALFLLICFLCYQSSYAKSDKKRLNSTILGVVAVIFWYFSALVFLLLSGLAH